MKLELSNFSPIVNGLGWLLCNLGSVLLLLVFHRNLHTVKELKPSRNAFSSNFIFSVIALTLFFGTSAILKNYVKIAALNTPQASIIFNSTLIFILIPKYYICQNHNLKLYVSVYHHHPPPVLPWQLPGNFDLKSVKLRSYVLEGTGEYQPYFIHLKPVKLTRVDHKE